ncbi:MAG TPA: Ig-like domain-containing protein, partial [Polyangiales bacterium]|nr:Ig-like domain-containing protein [Polyangiales bacterium]
MTTQAMLGRTLRVRAEVVDSNAQMRASDNLDVKIVAEPVSDVPQVNFESPAVLQRYVERSPIRYQVTASAGSGTQGSGIKYVEFMLDGSPVGTANFGLLERRGGGSLEIWRLDSTVPAISTNETTRSVTAIVHGQVSSTTTEPHLIRIVANRAPEASITSPSTGLAVGVGQNVNVVTSVIDDTLNAGVEFELLLNDQVTDTFLFSNPANPTSNALEQNQATHTFPIAITPAQVNSTLRLRLRATDAQGMVGQSQEVRLQVHSDQPPVVALSSPQAGSHHVSGQAIELRANASDDVRIARVDFFVDGRLVGSDIAVPFAFQYQTPAGLTTDQRLTLSASATDSAGHVTQSERVDVTIGRDDQRPVVNIVSPAIIKTSGGDEIAPVIERSQIVLRMTGYDNVGVDRLELRGVAKQGGAYVLTGNSSDLLTAPELTPEAIPGGLHAFAAFKLVNTPAFSGATGVTEDRYPVRVTATDTSGNSTVSEIAIAVRADAIPTIGVKQVDRPGFRPRDVAGLSVQALDDLAVAKLEVDYFVDGATNSVRHEDREIVPQAPNVQERFTLDLRTLGLSNAAHVVRAQLVAIDGKGKRSDQIPAGAASLDINVVPDHNQPLAAIYAPIPGVDLYRNENVTFSWRAVDDSRLTRFEVLKGTAEVFSTALTETHHEGTFVYRAPDSGNTLELSVRATDELGNVSTGSVSYPLVDDAPPTVSIRAPAPGTRLTEGEALTIS